MPNLLQRKNWIFSVTPENWETVKAYSIWATDREGLTQKMKTGDIAIFYVTRTSPPCFMGIYEVVSDWFRATKPLWPDEVEQEKILYPWQLNLKQIRLGTVNIKDLAPKLAFIGAKKNWQVYLVGTPANMQRPIGEEDYQLILAEMEKPPIQITFAPRRVPAGLVKEAERKKMKEETLAPPHPPTPSHRALIQMLHEVGEVLGFVARIEEQTPDGVYRCDATWRDYEAHSPIKVFEVEVSGNVDHALSSLAHAYDTWRPEGLYLIVSDESDLNRARKLVEPRVRGAFSKISGRLKVWTWPNLKELYDNIKPHEEFIRDLSKRL